MFLNYLKITFRLLWRNKVTSFVNIFGLGTGITAFIFIMLYVHHEFSYDKFHRNYDRIVRLEGDDYGKLPPIIATHLKGSLPEIENVTQLALGTVAEITHSPSANPDQSKTIEIKRFFADSSLFNVFSFTFIQGNPETALKDPMTVVLTESTSRKLFGDTDPMTKTIKFERHTFTITGIIKDIKSSHVEFDALFSYESFPTVFPNFNLNDVGPSDWLWSATYLLLSPQANRIDLEKKINESLKEINNGKVFNVEYKNFHVRPLKDLYLDGETGRLAYGLHGNLKLVRVLIAVGIFLLVLAGINYINLTTARSASRAKEIAIKRFSGSSSAQLRFQLMVESVIVSLISLLVAITLVQLSLSTFNEFASVNININDLNQPVLWELVLGGSIALGMLAGLYPAFYLTARKSLSLMKGGLVKVTGNGTFRSSLMTFQFAMSIIMIIAIIANIRQLNFVRSADLGFDKDHIITVSMRGADSSRFTFKDRLLQHSEIQKVSFSFGNPGMHVGLSPATEINGVKYVSKHIAVDPDYLDCMSIKVIAGRNLNWDNPADKADFGREFSILVNEATVRELGLDNPIGLAFHTEDRKYNFKIIGIVKDFHIQSFHEKLEPVMFFWSPWVGNVASIKVNGTAIPTALKNIEVEWKQVYGNAPFHYSFLDETFDRQYKSDEQLATMIGLFTGIAIIIACLGLFALSSFMVTSRTKEIGVRKVLGASVGKIYFMLSWDFLQWILVAVIVACPVAWFLMKMWLETFAYHISLSADIFLWSILLAIAIALATVTGQALKAANANPVKALKYE